MSLATDQELLAAWAAGSATGCVRRPLALLERALDVDADALARWPLGRRDAALLDLVAELFGGAVEATAACPQCGEVLELAFAVDAVRVSDQDSDPVDVAGGLAVRAPTTEDVVAAVAAGGNEDGVERALAARCAGIGADAEIDDATLTAIGAAVERIDPQADVRLAVACPVCEAQDEAAFDVADYLWRLVEARAREVIAEVDLLARAYGWSEADVLAMPHERRELYLDLVSA